MKIINCLFTMAWAPRAKRNLIIWAGILLLLSVMGSRVMAQTYAYPTNLSLGQSHSMAVQSDGKVWTWGGNVNGQLGIGNTNDAAYPIPVPGLSNIVGVTAGGWHSFALESSGTVKSWGNGEDGELGNGQTNGSSLPVSVGGLSGVGKLAGGAFHSLALTTNGQIWSWGYGRHGQLGTGSTSNRVTPIQVSNIPPVTALSAGREHSLAVATNGTVWAWGYNSDGQLGNGTTNNSTLAGQVPGLSNMVAVSAGQYHSLALGADGKVWGWGDNIDGELGFGTNIDIPNKSPVYLGISNAMAIAAGGYHSLVLLSNGLAYAFGFDDDGETGDGWTRYTMTPTRVPNIKEVKQIFAGGYHSAALRVDTTAWAWGYNLDGQLGDDSSFQRYKPVPIDGLTILAPGVANPLARSTRMARGLGLDATYTSFVIPLNGQKGVKLYPDGGNADVLFKTNMWTNALTHFNNGFTNAPAINFKTPIASFGRRVGGSPLYYDQSYDFGVYAGDPKSNTTNAVSVEVYDKSTLGFVTNFYVPLPMPNQTNQWANFLTNGYMVTTNSYGLTTTLSYRHLYTSWGTESNGCFYLSHIASPSNYFYLVQIRGALGTNQMVKQGSSNWWSRLYTVEFETRPAWRSVFVDSPQFDGEPVPPFYDGKSVDELQSAKVAITNLISLNPNTCTNIDQSPELRRHPILDQFVSDMGKDPLALANYVLNEIDITDGLGYDDTGHYGALNQAGVSRSALGTYLEGQGSPTEQCALLVYLLRQAGYPALYVYPPYNGLKMLDSRMSRILRMQFKGLVKDFGEDIMPQIIPVNYPWVAFYASTNNGASTNWIHVFPWIKDIQLVEGLDLYKNMPSNYNNAYKIMKSYCMGDTNILWIDRTDDTLGYLLPKFISKCLLADPRTANLSLDDMGIKTTFRKNYYSRWSDFPGPTWFTNSIIPVESLSSSAITNVAPSMTNIFDTINITVYSQVNTNTRISTGDMNMMDVHNRKLLVRHERNGGGGIDMILSLAPYRPGPSNKVKFSNVNFGSPTDTNVVLNVVTTNTLATSDDVLQVAFSYKRHRSAGLNPLSGWEAFPGITESFHVNTVTRPIRKGDLAAICLSYGKVTRKMMNVHAQEFWDMEQSVRKTPSLTNSIPKEIYQGTPAFLTGMGWYERDGRVIPLNEQLHKTHNISYLGYALATLKAKRDATGNLPTGNLILTKPGVDITFSQTTVAANGLMRPDQGRDSYGALADFSYINIVNGSAQEHRVLNVFYGESNSVSTVKLLQNSQKATNSGGPGMLVLNQNNYLNYGGSNFNGTLLKATDTNMWKELTNAFVGRDATNTFPEWTSTNFAQAFVTPGKMTNDSGGYKGVGALMFSGDGYSEALIGENTIVNGGIATILADLVYDVASILAMNLGLTSDGELTFNWSNPSSTDVRAASDNIPTFQAPSEGNNAPNETSNDNQKQADKTTLQLAGANLGTDAQNRANALTTKASSGSFSLLSWFGDRFRFVADPVNVMTGEFYVDAVDLSIKGPIKLEVRRNYTSRNLVNNNLGYGWKLNYMPFLSFTADTNYIYAAEPDGSVLAYIHNPTNNLLWTPDPKSNPHVNNRGVGGTENVFNNKILRQIVGPTNFYKLYTVDGSLRTFQYMSFTNTFTNSRPFLIQWQDCLSNSLSFEYGTNQSSPDFGQMRRISSTAGNFLGFEYDIYSRITEAYCQDGRRLYYYYDDFGDMVRVVAPDASEISYEYEHLPFSVTNGATVTKSLYSTHVLVRELKPDGRVLENTYDDQRRVTNQAATVGLDLNLVRNAIFIYTNNYKLTNSFTNGVTGFTIVKDAFNNPTRFEYTNSLITLITDALGATVKQDWYESGETNKAGYYPQSLEQTIDKRGLITSYKYDLNGNATNITVSGDLQGLGATNEVAVSSFLYDTNNLLTKAIDPSGNTNLLFYTNTWLVGRLEVWPTNSSVSTAVSNVISYYNVTNGLNSTQFSIGLKRQEVRAAGTSDAAISEWSYDYRGLITQTIRYSGTSDPNITNSLSYNLRNELVEQVDAAGRRTHFAYDGMGRLIQREVYEVGQDTPIFWENSYFNANGELVWSDGPKYDPEDYVWRDYDGAGRKTQEVRWRSRAKADGSGVETETGDNQFSTTFFAYDPFGNLTNITDSLGNYVVKGYDSLGQLTNEVFYGSSTGALATNQYRYEAGGAVSQQTTPLGATVQMAYTYAGKLKFRQNPDGSTNAWRFYVDGRPWKEVLPNGSYWETIYDDANRTVRRIFKSSSNAALTSETKVFDRRGNLIQTTNVDSYVFTTTYDGVDRVKSSYGPPAGSFNSQQGATNYYDAAGVATTNINGLGESTVTTRDAIGRITSLEVRANNQSLVSKVSNQYAANHHSVTTVLGTANQVVTTTYTDNDGKPVLTQSFSGGGAMNYRISSYDVLGNLVTNRDELGQNTTSAYDGLNRITQTVTPDGATTQVRYNAAGGMTNRSMPGGLTWSGSYDLANRMVAEQLTGTNGAVTRTNKYLYASFGPIATNIDARNITNIFSYNDFMRVSQAEYSGPSPEDYFLKGFSYDYRGNLTIINETAGGMNTRPDMWTSRAYDGYGQITGELVEVNGVPASHLVQRWDGAGRRIGTGIGSYLSAQGQGSGTTNSYSYRADGRMTSVVANGQTYAFDYGDSGLLSARSNAFRSVSIQRDGRGRILQQVTTAAGSPALSESVSWRANSTMQGYSAVRPTYTDARSYTYNSRGQLLTESLVPTNGQTVSIAYGFDPAKLGVRTSAIQSGSMTNSWLSGDLDGFFRVQSETSYVGRVSTRASGLAVGAAAVTASLDGSPLQGLSFDNSNGRWAADLDLNSGSHTLVATAHHPSGAFHPSNTNTFNAGGRIAATSSYDAAGNLIAKAWTNGHSQSLTWGPEGRLMNVTDKTGSTTNYLWTAIYDGIGRRVRITTTPITNGVAASSTTINSWYDPQVEFLEIAVEVNGFRTWKVYGPDVSGSFGRSQGIGGLEATVVESAGETTSLLNDVWGNSLATVSLTSLIWNSVRLSSYGALEGFQGPALNASSPLSKAVSWQGRYQDVTGLTYNGARYYDQLEGRFISADSWGHKASEDLYSLCNGDPANGTDPDGRLGKKAANFVNDNILNPLLFLPRQILYWGAFRWLGGSYLPTLPNVTIPNPGGDPTRHGVFINGVNNDYQEAINNARRNGAYMNNGDTTLIYNPTAKGDFAGIPILSWLLGNAFVGTARDVIEAFGTGLLGLPNPTADLAAEHILQFQAQNPDVRVQLNPHSAGNAIANVVGQLLPYANRMSVDVHTWGGASFLGNFSWGSQTLHYNPPDLVPAGSGASFGIFGPFHLLRSLTPNYSVEGIYGAPPFIGGSLPYHGGTAYWPDGGHYHY